MPFSGAQSGTNWAWFARAEYCAVVFLFAGPLWSQHADTVFQGALISSGRNRPSVNMNKEKLNDVCALLHRRLSLSEISGRLGVSEEELRHKLDLLQSEGLAKKVSEDQFVPACMVVNLEDAQKYLHPDTQVIDAAVQLLRTRIPEVKAECRKIKPLANVPFETISFLVGSDVLLDNWQIANVERLFVKADRPLRNGSRYYYMVFEKPAGQTREPFGIYGNTGSTWGSVQIALYGNDRFSGHTLLSIPDAEFNQRFGFDASLDLKEARRQLADKMVRELRGEPGALTPIQRQALSQFGLIHENKLNMVLLQPEDNTTLNQVASIVTADLIQLLEGHRAKLLAVYRSSPYAEETSFDEFFMCWYHFFYSAVTNRLRDQGVIDVPASGTINYLVAQ